MVKIVYSRKLVTVFSWLGSNDDGEHYSAQTA